MRLSPLVMLPVLGLVGCVVPEPPILLDVPEDVRHTVPGLRCEAHVVRTAGDVPHVYAHDRLDAARALGFAYARDRFFTLDAARRLSQGRLAELLGDLALPSDLSARLEGQAAVARQLHETLTAGQRDWLGAYAEGVNAYVDAVEAGDLPLPSELELAGPLLGVDDPASLMDDFTSEDVAAVAATLIFQLGWEPDDAAKDLARREILAGPYPDGTAEGVERQEALEQDLLGRIEPLFDLVSAQGWEVQPRPERDPDEARAGSVPDALLRRTVDALRARHPADAVAPRGSNAWAVRGAATADGRTLLAGDGHLPLTVPSLFWQMGLDTSLLEHPDDIDDGPARELTQVGLGLPGLPTLAVGTNGRVAWSQTRLRGDITDMYGEQIRLGDDGLPADSLFQEDWRPLVPEDEAFEVANVPLLGSTGRTVDATLYTTFDGRRIVDVEGRLLADDEEPADDEVAVWTLVGRVVPGDTDTDGVVAAVSIDFTAYDPTALFTANDRFGTADDVSAFRDATAFLNGYGQNMVAADASGSVLYTGYQAQPCRTYLRRDATGFREGSHPGYLLDGTVHPGFTVPTTSSGLVDERFAGDPARCVVPFDSVPWAVDPESGFVLSANEDPGGHAVDGDIANDRWYLGGPWDGGFRARRIDERLAALVEEGTADLASMQALQADTQSPFGRIFAPYLLDALDRAAAGEAELGPLWAADERLDGIRDRLSAWSEGGFDAPSGVASTYHQPAEGDAADSVATMIFNAWFGRWVDAVLGDEPIPDDAWQPNRSTGQTRLLLRMLQDRDGDAPYALAGIHPATGESVLFDRLGTDEVETSDGLMLTVLTEALDALEGPGANGQGGFGTTDQDAWRWGLRHQVRFDSILGTFLGDDPLLSGIFADFAITPDVIDPGEGLRSLPHFPRGGDNASVDAASWGFGVEDFTYGTGPSFRMVVALGGDDVEGVNILPGGQSALTDSPHFADQAALWLGNEALPMWLDAADVVENATGRELLLPEGGADCSGVE